MDTQIVHSNVTVGENGHLYFAGADTTVLAEKYLDSLLRAEGICLFSTHLHELARRCADKAGYVTLSARPNSYQIAPERPGGSSYAEQIARSYGLD